MRRAAAGYGDRPRRAATAGGHGGRPRRAATAGGRECRRRQTVASRPHLATVMVTGGRAGVERSSVMVPAEGLGWPDRPPAATRHPVVPPGLHRGHAEPEGPELSWAPGAVGGPLADAAGLGWPGDEHREIRTDIGVAPVS